MTFTFRRSTVVIVVILLVVSAGLIAASRATAASSTPVVYVATGENFPDALGAASAAAVSGGPVLLVTRTSIPGDTMAELTRLAPDKIVVAGGTAVVSEAVFDALKAYAPSVVRAAGANRYATAVAVSESVFPVAPSGGGDVAALTAAVNALTERVDAQDTKIASLEAENAALAAQLGAAGTGLAALDTALAELDAAQTFAVTARGTDPSRSVTSDDEIVVSVEVTAPVDGHVTVNSSHWIWEGTAGDKVRCSITTGEAIDFDYEQRVESGGSGGGMYQALASTRGFEIAAGATVAYNLVCDHNGSSGSTSVYDAVLTAIFTPAS